MEKQNHVAGQSDTESPWNSIWNSNCLSSWPTISLLAHRRLTLNVKLHRGCTRNRGSICSWRWPVQMGTAYLLSPEARISPLYRQALRSERDRTALTNAFTECPARTGQSVHLALELPVKEITQRLAEEMIS